MTTYDPPEGARRIIKQNMRLWPVVRSTLAVSSRMSMKWHVVTRVRLPCARCRCLWTLTSRLRYSMISKSIVFYCLKRHEQRNRVRSLNEREARERTSCFRVVIIVRHSVARSPHFAFYPPSSPCIFHWRHLTPDCLASLLFITGV